MSKLEWRNWRTEPLVCEAKPEPDTEYHVTIADDGKIRGQRLLNWRQVWVSDEAKSYEEAKVMCQSHWDETFAEREAQS